MDASDGWCVGQVHLRARIHGETSLEVIGRRVHVPAAVLEPAFHTGCGGRLPRPGTADHLRLTEEQASARSTGSSRHGDAWLAQELADWGAVDDELLRQSSGRPLATQFVDEDPQLQAPVGAGAG